MIIQVSRKKNQVISLRNEGVMLIFVKGCQSARTFAFSYGLEDVLRVFSVAKVVGRLVISGIYRGKNAFMHSANDEIIE